MPETSQDQYICLNLKDYPSDKAETHCAFDGFRRRLMALDSPKDVNFIE